MHHGLGGMTVLMLLMVGSQAPAADSTHPDIHLGEAIRLLCIEEVRSQLALTQDQADRLERLEHGDGGSGWVLCDPSTANEGLNSSATRIVALLEPIQLEKLLQIHLRSSGPSTGLSADCGSSISMEDAPEGGCKTNGTLTDINTQVVVDESRGENHKTGGGGRMEEIKESVQGALGILEEIKEAYGTLKAGQPEEPEEVSSEQSTETDGSTHDSSGVAVSGPDSGAHGSDQGGDVGPPSGPRSGKFMSLFEHLRKLGGALPSSPVGKTKGRNQVLTKEDPSPYGSLSGRVVSMPLDRPIVGARVAVAGGRYARTNNEGAFSLPHLRPGIYVLRVDAVGHLGTELKVQIQPGKLSKLRVDLKKKSARQAPLRR